MDFVTQTYISSGMRDPLEQIISQLRAGDRAGLEALYALTSARVYRTVTDILGTNSAANDVFKEVYKRIWQDRAQWKTKMGPDELAVCQLARRLALRARYADGRRPDQQEQSAPTMRPETGRDVQ